MEKRYWILFFSGKIVLRESEDNCCHLFFGETCPIEAGESYTYEYHTTDGAAVSVVDLASEPKESHYIVCTLRESYEHLSLEEYILAGKSWELLYWDRHTRYCGACGSETELSTEISKRCPQCGEEYWPLLNVAVICLIYRGEEVLMVRAKNFRNNFFGLIAGFVETGETLEQALRREVKEETSISIKNIRYFDSQPWPYPSNLMVGFYAEYAGGELHLQQSELERGGWFHRDSLPNLPHKLSIARRLIDNWLAKDCKP